MDGNEAVAYVAYRTNEVISIYPITPSSAMGEHCDEWASQQIPNIWNTIPHVIEMQSEAGAAGTVHGALQTGALTTTFTASQGLLLMIPNMYKIAGELTPTVIHVAARSLACQGLSIFGDHSDVMAARSTGFALLCSCSVQECMDMALISQATTLKSRIPMLHFFDGFRTSHEVSKIEVLPDSVIETMMDPELINQHRQRSLSPDRPVLRGTAQNPDVYFQARETVNPFYDQCPQILQTAMDQFQELTGRSYHLFDYYGDTQAEKVIVVMGSAGETIKETVEHLNTHGEKVGVIIVRLFRPFSRDSFLNAIPKTTKAMAVLDRTKEPGSAGDPLYLECVQALYENIQTNSDSSLHRIRTIAGRYGLSSKEFTPAMIKSIFDELSKPQPKNYFTIGIEDDVSHSHLVYDPNWQIESPNNFKALFYGLGSDGTVGANKNTIKIIGDQTNNHVQAYFVYDSKKSGAITISHLRFGPEKIQSHYLIHQADFVGCHQFHLIEQYDLIENLRPGGSFLINTSTSLEDVWTHLPLKIQKEIKEKQISLFAINAYEIAKNCGLGGRINTIMQVCFFTISKIIDQNTAIQSIKDMIQKSYGMKGQEIVAMNLKAVDEALTHLTKIQHQETNQETKPTSRKISDTFFNEVLSPMIAQKGDSLRVSQLPNDGTYPTGTSQWEKRNIALEIPIWKPDLCIQCAKCVYVCPHSCIRVKIYDDPTLKTAPETFQSTPTRFKEFNDLNYTIQVSPEDCTGCGICVDICPAKSKSETRIKAINMESKDAHIEPEKLNWEFFNQIPDFDRSQLKIDTIRHQQLQQPLFEFSGACSGCGETPYVKLVSQLFGDRALIANATGCSSIYGGNLPTTPWTKNNDGRGPTWSNSLFEDNAEFGLGFSISVEKQKQMAQELLQRLNNEINPALIQQILDNPQKDEADIFEQRKYVDQLKTLLPNIKSPLAQRLIPIADQLVKKSIWIMGGDGWAYDIGFGGLDHVFSTRQNVNILVLDTEVYSNTGGQMSKATPKGAIAKFAVGGKQNKKKDLGLIAMTYGHVYVAKVAMGAKDEHTLKAFLEAEAYDGPSLIIAYSHCIAHGIIMKTAMQNQKAAVQSGQWLLYRYHPEKTLQGENPLKLDSPKPKLPVDQYFQMENRFRMLKKMNPEESKRLTQEAQEEAINQWEFYNYLSKQSFKDTGKSNES